MSQSLREPPLTVPETFAVVGALCGLAEKDPPASARLALKLAYEMRALVLLENGAHRARGALSSADGWCQLLAVDDITGYTSRTANIK